jgi:hypothetical protein
MRAVAGFVRAVSANNRGAKFGAEARCCTAAEFDTEIWSRPKLEKEARLR